MLSPNGIEGGGGLVCFNCSPARSDEGGGRSSFARLNFMPSNRELAPNSRPCAEVCVKFVASDTSDTER